MPNHQPVLNIHHQLSERSCAAEAMELILKLHGIVKPDWFDFQNRCKDENIGFGHLSLLSPFGVSAAAGVLGKDQIRQLLREETQAERFPLVSLVSGIRQDPVTRQLLVDSHIWTALPHDHSFHLVAGISNSRELMLRSNFDQMADVTLQTRTDGMIDYVSYKLTPLRKRPIEPN